MERGWRSEIGCMPVLMTGRASEPNRAAMKLRLKCEIAPGRPDSLLESLMCPHNRSLNSASASNWHSELCVNDARGKERPTLLENDMPTMRIRSAPRTTGRWPFAGAMLLAWSIASGAPTAAQETKPAAEKGAPQAKTTRANVLRGEYGPYRANNDLLYYHLDVRVDPEKQTIGGKNTVRFRMLKDDAKIQLDLHPALSVEKILLGDVPLKFEREESAVFVSFPETLKADQVYSIDFYYAGKPATGGRFGGMAFRKDPAGRPWIYTSCEMQGASVWWPNKDQWRDEVESMDLSVTIPSGLVDASNGRFIGKTDLGVGLTRWDWRITYPINNYCVSLNIGNYVHFDDKLGDLTLDFYALPENLEKAKKQFAQAKGMLEAFQHYFGEYPFKNDGYKLIEVPYAGMEHQSAVTYGNHFKNGYMERDWTGVGISPRFDFIIIHESGHEWFGNSVSAADRADMWIHEGWTTYLECLYVEYHFGRDDALKYTNGYKSKVRNIRPIIGTRGENANPPQDQYFKGALFLNTLRSVIDDDKRWWAILRGLHDRFKHKNIMTEDVVQYFNKETGKDLTPIFDQYLRRTALPILELKFDEQKGVVSYRWKADEPSFAMPLKVGTKDKWQVIQPTKEWQEMKTTLKKDQFAVATDLYYIAVSKL
jgi:aminopeptidase N